MKSPVRWLKAYWDEGDVLIYFEADEDGWVLRQVDLEGPEQTPTAAAVLAELLDARDAGTHAVGRY